MYDVELEQGRDDGTGSEVVNAVRAVVTDNGDANGVGEEAYAVAKPQGTGKSRALAITANSQPGVFVWRKNYS